MAASTPLSLIILVTLNIQLLLLLSPHTRAQTPSAPAPAPAGTVNLTGILDKNGQYTTFIGLLTETQVANQIENQLNTSSEGLTVFAPTDNAFNNLKSGAINGLSTQEKVQLVLYHVSPKYYRLVDLLTVTNPVRTQAAGNDGNWGLNFTGHGNQVNVTTGIVTTQINNALRQQFPLGLYQVDMVLLPEELFGAEPPASAPPPAKTPSTTSNTTTNTSAPASPTEGTGASGRNVVGWGLSLGLAMLCMQGALS
ncbi:fasciclin-like arabinogalactan protein 13 [Juglans regia]|uniref:Fasciclin-like arabinogalactan protein 13 n=1 Tax=Juglans regia TaxID=51240 RepID=A0A2I4DQB1_JUGRE|nr:fasciclin-like arabinogalactan protein 13 [Juglans regia]